jgi:hypothetical protein
MACHARRLPQHHTGAASGHLQALQQARHVLDLAQDALQRLHYVRRAHERPNGVLSPYKAECSAMHVQLLHACYSG